MVVLIINNRTDPIERTDLSDRHGNTLEPGVQSRIFRLEVKGHRFNRADSNFTNLTYHMGKYETVPLTG